MENKHESKLVRNIVIGIAIVVFILGILQIGISIGERRARFAGEFGDNFERNFVGPMGMGPGGFLNENPPGGHGAAGEIISINLPQIVISGPDNLEKTILVSASTTIRLFQDNIQTSQLKTGDFIVILGNPNNNGQIEAKLIRIMPSPDMAPVSSSTKSK